ncbi:hypothetical protein ACSDR0_45680 [Streptosporangium sp. G11]|uniref:hypothetical protein n=1 Tax=Streptosporangium sp. G11 TaxID=3436926 RepID=UPI003EC023A6
MSSPQPPLSVGMTRFAASGEVEVYDGTDWIRYEPPLDDGMGTILKDFDSPFGGTEQEPR